MIQDGYCDTCGMAPAPAASGSAPSGPSASPGPSAGWFGASGPVSAGGSSRSQFRGSRRTSGRSAETRALRFGLERTYRALARLTPDESRRIELVDMANAIRPRTLT